MRKNGAKRSAVGTITVLSIVALLLVSLTVAFLTDSRSTLNILGIGTDDEENGQKAVQIALLEEAFGTLDNAEATPLDGGIAGEYTKVVLNDLLPGDKVNKDSTVKNVGRHDVYVRVQLTNEAGDVIDATAAPYNELNFAVGSDWTYHAATGYFYYTGGGNTSKILESDATVAVFENLGTGINPYTIEISTDISNDTLAQLSGLIDIKVKVDAIQAANFTPNPLDGTEDPWNGEAILEANDRWNGQNGAGEE